MRLLCAVLIMRYKKFLLEESEIPTPPNMSDKEDGEMVVIKFERTEVEQCEYRNQNKLITALFVMITELFELRDLELHTSTWSNSFFLITKDETDFNNQQGILSPELSRKKLKDAEPKEVAEAVIDLVRDRKNWNQEKFYRSLNGA